MQSARPLALSHAVPTADSQRLPRVVIVDSNSLDAATAKRVFNMLHPAPLMEHFSLGEDALSSLRANAELGETPDLVITDLGLGGGVSGFELIEAVTSDSRFASVPVIAYTASPSRPQQRAAYTAGAVGLFLKQIGAQAATEVLMTIHDFYLRGRAPVTWPILAGHLR